MKSPLGYGYAIYSMRGLCKLMLPANSENLAKAEGRNLASQLVSPSHQASQEIQRFINAYFSGEEPNWQRVIIDLKGTTPFQRKVYTALRNIDFGETVTYGALGQQLGYRYGGRAIGSAMRTNPLPLIIPCHRVVAANQKLQGFSAPGGIATKKWLLEHEAAYAC